MDNPCDWDAPDSVPSSQSVRSLPVPVFQYNDLQSTFLFASFYAGFLKFLPGYVVDVLGCCYGMYQNGSVSVVRLIIYYQVHS